MHTAGLVRSEVVPVEDGDRGSGGEASQVVDGRNGVLGEDFWLFRIREEERMRDRDAVHRGREMGQMVQIHRLLGYRKEANGGQFTTAL